MKILENKFKYAPDVHVFGLTKELNILYIINYYRKHDKNVIVLTNTLYEANNFFKLIKTYEPDCLFFPMDDFLTSVAVAISPDFKIKRLEVLDKLTNESKNKHIIVTSLMGYLKFLPNIKEETNFVINPSLHNISREIIITKLEEYGYKKEALVTATGEYAVRGFIIDVFPINYSFPIRIEFFGDEVECIKRFNENTQRSIEKLDSVEIKKISESVDNNPSSLLEYVPNNAVFLIYEDQIKASYNILVNEMFEYRASKNLPQNEEFMFSYDDIKCKEKYNLETVDTYGKGDNIIYNSKEILNFNSDFDKLKTYCLNEVKTNTIIFSLVNDNQIKQIMSIFKDAIITTENKIINNRINIIKTAFNKGFKIDNIILISPQDIEKSVHQDIKYKNTIKIGRKIKTYNDLTYGDYIVHESYGIGIYKGLKTIKKGGNEKDYIQLEYLNNDKVYIPVENIDILYKYISKEGTTPKINKLNSTAWIKKKLETRKKIKDISRELIELYTSRSNIKNEPFKDYEEELIFAMNFPYTLTEDQEKSIKEIEQDLKTSIPMDRLLCGDVGYGKTEVAFRAMFKAVINGFQVAYLCPTTILSKQQYNNAVERFKDFPVTIELLNRYTPIKKVKEIINKLDKGTLDIVIGTHKLLNSDIKYRKLGLLVIDEEQRFGVSHKEKIKDIKRDINVLTLSATPIPRTLKMAMSGLRSLSILDTPPINRYPIQTYVIEENDLLIKDAIYKEMSRSGQVYILVNNISNMLNFKRKLESLVPEAKIVCAHGQMVSSEINSIMERFISGEYDILLCTTIIETGIDIANVNTIIILDADKFGLSQLYQIRGRVGRSDKIAYAYLMYNPQKVLTETASKRLNSIKEFTELGSGYKIAMRDLSIRGAGDLLGSEQAGFIDSVGIDLYTKMINEEIKILTGEEIEDNISLSNTQNLNIATHIDDTYVDDESLKIEIHKLINSIKNKEDYLNIRNELIDRFGKLNEDIEIYILERYIVTVLKNNKASIEQDTRKVTIILSEENSDKIDGEKLFLEVYNINPKFQISYKNKRIYISLLTFGLQKNYIYYLNDLVNILFK